jgi:hypothetical protein
MEYKSRGYDYQFRGQEGRVLELIRAGGEKLVIETLEVKHPTKFRRWLTSRLKLKKDAKPKKKRMSPQDFSNLATLRGGWKHKWLSEHKDLILEVNEIFGEAIAMKLFKVSPQTLDNLTHTTRKPTNHPNFNGYRNREAERMVVELRREIELLQMRCNVLAEGQSQDRAEHNEIKRAFAEFVPAVANQLGGNLAKVVSGYLSNLTLPAELLEQPKADPLNMDFLVAQAKGMTEVRR